MKILIVCDSLTGNTQIVAELIRKELIEQYGYTSVRIASPLEKKEVTHFDIVFLGSYTWGKGELPHKMKNYLRYIFVDNVLENYPTFSIFGTGDTQWGGIDLVNYCRAVDAMYYYCCKYATEPKAYLKIEQSPVSKYQKQQIINFVSETMEGL